MSNRSLTRTSIYKKWFGSEQIRTKKKNQDAGLMHYLWDKLVLDAESRIKKKNSHFLYLFFLYCCIYESSKYQQYCRNEEECVDSRHFSSAGTWIKEAILLVNASNGLSNENIWHFTQHHWNRKLDGGALFSRVREHLYKVFVKVFIFVKTVLHKN